MKVSAAGRAAIRVREGCRLAAYRDTRGIWTIGVGHVNMTPPAVTPGMRITEAQADQFLAADLAPVEAMIAGAVKVPLTQNEFDALASLGFNIGANGLRRCTVVGRLNRGDRAGAAQAFLLWAHPSELMGRRRAEMKQFQASDGEPQPRASRAGPRRARRAGTQGGEPTGARRAQRTRQARRRRRRDPPGPGSRVRPDFPHRVAVRLNRRPSRSRHP